MFLVLALSLGFVVKDVWGGAGIATSFRYDGYARAFAISRALLIAIALAIALKRERNRSDVLLFGGIAGLSLDAYWEFVPLGWPFYAVSALSNCAVGAGMFELVRYAASSIELPSVRRVSSGLATVVGILIAVAGTGWIWAAYGTIGGHLAGQSTIQAMYDVRWIAMIAASLAIEVAASIALRSRDERVRPRALLVVVGFAPLVIATVVHGCATLLFHTPEWVNDLDAVGNLATAGLLAYGALTRRLMDIEFAVNAAIVTAVLISALTVVVFLLEHFGVPLVDQLVERIPGLEKSNDTIRTATQLAAGFCAFLIISRIHEAAGDWIRGIVFGHREEHLEALRAFADEAVETLGAHDIGRALVDAAVEHGRAEFAALYLRRHGAFELDAASDRTSRPKLSESDPAAPLSRLPKKLADGGIALPMTAGARVTGFLYCGPKRDRTEYAPDETAALALATREAGLAVTPPLESDRRAPGRAPQKRRSRS